MHEIRFKSTDLKGFITTPFILTVLSVGIYALVFKVYAIMSSVSYPNLKQFVYGGAWGLVFYTFIFLVLFSIVKLLKYRNVELFFKSPVQKHAVLFLIYVLASTISLFILSLLFSGKLIFVMPLTDILLKTSLPVATLLIFTPLIFENGKIQKKENGFPVLNTYQGKVKINPDSIFYIEYSDRKTNIVTADDTFVLNMSLSKLLSVLNLPSLIKISRDVAIHKDRVKEIRELSGSKYLVRINKKEFEITAKMYEGIRALIV